MTYPTEITMSFADGEYRFFLPIPQVTELESGGQSMCALEFRLRESIGLTIDGEAIYGGGNAVDADSIRKIIRLALIGGNGGTVEGEKVDVGPQRARELVETYVYPARPLAEGAALAWRILATAIYGNEPKPVEAEQVSEEEQADG